MPNRSVRGAALAVALLLAACSSGDSDGDGAASDAADLRVVGRDLRFDLENLSARAGRPFTIVFDNRDQGVPHNLAVYRSGPPASGQVAATETRPGTVTQRLALPALDAGRYFFQCDVHPTTMTGTLTVE